jgi:hypothetical protein
MPWPAAGSASRTEALVVEHRALAEAVADRDGATARSHAESGLNLQTGWLVERRLQLAARRTRPGREAAAQ